MFILFGFEIGCRRLTADRKKSIRASSHQTNKKNSTILFGILIGAT
jgi:hypothetical protein